MCSSVHINNENKDTLILAAGLTKGLDDATSKWQHSFLFVNATKIYQFKINSFEIKKYSLCLGNI